MTPMHPVLFLTYTFLGLGAFLCVAIRFQLELPALLILCLLMPINAGLWVLACIFTLYAEIVR